MLKNKVVSAVLTAVLVAGVLTGCGGSKPAQQTPAAQPTKAAQPTQATQPAASGKMTDGVYKVEYDNFDSHGYKPQLEMTVKDGKITEVKYDEITKDGKFKSQDEQYKAQMQKGSSTYPQKAFDELKKKLVEKQGVVDAVAGATASSKTFNGLVKHAVDEMAKKGVTAPAKIPVLK